MALPPFSRRWVLDLIRARGKAYDEISCDLDQGVALANEHVTRRQFCPRASISVYGSDGRAREVEYVAIFIRRCSSQPYFALSLDALLRVPIKTPGLTISAGLK